MKHLFVLSIFIGLILSLNSCDTKDNPDVQKYGLSKEEAKSKLNEMSKNLASNKEWLYRASSELIENCNLSLSKVSETLQSKMIIDGVEYDIKISLYNYDDSKISLLAKIADDAPYGVMLDPDRFYSEETLIPIDYWNGTSLETNTISLVPVNDDEEFMSEEEELAREYSRDSARSAIGFPLFCLDVEQSNDDPEIDYQFRELINQRLSELNKTTAESKPYLVIKRINLFDKKDSGDDEFEMYIGEDQTYSARIFGTTIHRFNGTKRNDAAGRNVYYRDVNGKQGWEIMPDNIAIFLMKWINPYAWMRIVPIEDDDDAGKHDHGDGPSIRQAWVKYYEVFGDTIKSNFWDYQVASPNSFWGDNDDLYCQAGIDKINENTVRSKLGPNYLNDTMYVKIESRRLNDVDYWFGVRTY